MEARETIERSRDVAEDFWMKLLGDSRITQWETNRVLDEAKKEAKSLIDRMGHTEEENMIIGTSYMLGYLEGYFKNKDHSKTEQSGENART
ncbi:hypothetical protein D3C80_1937580 [compost metagenome]